MLTINHLSEDRLHRLELIENLHSQGLNCAQIATFLNEKNIQTPRGLRYNAKIVWVTLHKYQKRKKRFNSTELSVEQDYFYVKKGAKLQLT